LSESADALECDRASAGDCGPDGARADGSDSVEQRQERRRYLDAARWGSVAARAGCGVGKRSRRDAPALACGDDQGPRREAAAIVIHLGTGVSRLSQRYAAATRVSISRITRPPASPFVMIATP